MRVLRQADGTHGIEGTAAVIGVRADIGSLTESIVPTEALVTDMVMEPAIEKKVEKAQNDHGLVVPFKPSLRAPTKK